MLNAISLTKAASRQSKIRHSGLVTANPPETRDLGLLPDLDFNPNFNPNPKNRKRRSHSFQSLLRPSATDSCIPRALRRFPMALKEDGSDAFNLLNLLYNDDEDDDMEDADNNEDVESNPLEHQTPQGHTEMDSGERDLGGPDVVAASAGEDLAQIPLFHNGSTSQGDMLRPSTPHGDASRPSTSHLSQMSFSSLSQEGLVDSQKSRRERPVIVDYGHDEVAASPEAAEDGKILGNGRVMFGEELQTANADFQDRTPTGSQSRSLQSTPEPYVQVDALEPDNDLLKQSETKLSENVHMSEDVATVVDPLAKFLPPPPSTKCSPELHEKINGFLALKRLGKNFNAEVRNRKGYRNPDFLQHAVNYQGVDETGSCFSKDVFDPHGYDASDYYEAIEADMKREMERKAQEKKKNQKVDFVSGGTQPTVAVTAQKLNLQVPGMFHFCRHALIDMGMAPAVSEGRSNKKSKWDKVDGDRRSTVGGRLDAVSTAGTHSEVPSGVNTGNRSVGRQKREDQVIREWNGDFEVAYTQQSETECMKALLRWVGQAGEGGLDGPG
ncbi:SAP30-binding protein-like protein [Drosera capensis]